MQIECNMKTRKKTDDEDITIADLYSKLIEIEEKLKKFDVVENQLKELKDSQDFLNSMYEEQKNEIENLKKSNKEIYNENRLLKSAIKQLENDISDTKMDVNNLEQYGRREMLEIFGVPREHDENTDEIVKKIADKIKVPIDINNDIEISHRTSLKPKAPIIIKFNNRRKRNTFYLQGRKIKLKSSMFVKQEQDSAIFINESLTFYNKDIFKKTKEKLKDKYKYIWLKNGITLIKRDDKSRVEKVLSLDDLRQY